ncbi:hypothetical protein C8D92_1026 [Tamilnaduibacter salinus]|uniref:Uncharacterized protein n=1 Tax=Tamilnaduibacter salinus TaxID=1484056 RepID=A0A2U1CZ78_9GAMM|nr:hypothetical protein C8D92_1026 [Tamilnaduibacter salinus]
MLAPDEAEKASEAILEPSRERLAKKQRKRLRWSVRFQKFRVALLGFIVGGLLGDYFFGDLYPWNVVGLAIGLFVAAILRRFPVPVNK